jgi:hypothetical protein
VNLGYCCLLPPVKFWGVCLASESLHFDPSGSQTSRFGGAVAGAVASQSSRFKWTVVAPVGSQSYRFECAVAGPFT